jgi:hypothetical protein
MYNDPLPPPCAFELVYRCRVLIWLLIDSDHQGIRDNLSFILSEQLDLLLKALNERRIDG